MAHLVFALTPRTHTMYRNGSGIGLLRDSEAVQQTVKTRLLTHFNEWFLDLSAGLPWFTDIATHNPNFKFIESAISREIISTDGVVTLTQFALSFQGSPRKLLIDFAYTDVYGNTISDSLEGVV